MRREGEAWTPAEHLRHLDRSVRGGDAWPGVSALAAAAALRTGAAALARLAARGKATPAFIPPREAVAEGEVAAYRARLLERWADANVRIREAVERWPERALDRIRLPHPLLGLLTVREMLLLTDLHLVEGARRRLSGQPA